MGAPDPIYFQLFPTIGKGELRRLEIVRTAINLIAKQGEDGVVFHHIAEKMKTRRSHIIYYFKERSELLETVLKYITATAQAITVEEVKKAKTPREQLLAVSDGAFAWAEKHPEQARVMIYLYHVFATDSSFKKLHTVVREVGVRRIGSLLRQAVGEKKVAPFTLEVMAKGIQTLTTGLLFEDFVISGNKSGREFCRQAIEQWIDGISGNS